MYEHEQSHNRHVRTRITEIKTAGYKIVYEKWFESDDEDFCYWMEIYLIDYFGRENLCNLGRGGLGPPSGENHPSKDPKFRAAMSRLKKGKRYPGALEGLKKGLETARAGGFQGAKKGRETMAANGYQNLVTARKNYKLHGRKPDYAGEKNPFYGKRHTEETNQKNREAHLGKPSWNKGKKLSEEHRKNLSTSHTGYVMPEEQKIKISKALLGKRKVFSFRG